MSTPMFEQYQALKAAHPAAVLLFRMGDFYECFFDDAKLVAEELELTLTTRNKADPDPIPMAGVPHHAAASYIQRLVDRGHKVAIAEQLEDPATAKGLVKRDVVRVVTPGCVLDPTSLESRHPNYLVALCPGGLAVADLSTGDFRIAEVSTQQCVAEIVRLEPREALLATGLSIAEVDAVLRRLRTVVSTVTEDAWEATGASRRVAQSLSVPDLAGLGIPEDHKALPAASAVLRYATDVTRVGARNLKTIVVYRPDGFMVLDETTRRNLEITATLVGGRRKGSLLHLCDHTVTAMGSRLLREWLSCPLLDVSRIQARQAAVSDLVDAPSLLADLAGALKRVSDIERIVARVAQGTAHARDLSALRSSLYAVPEVVSAASNLDTLRPHLPEDPCTDVLEDLDRWLVDDPPIALTEGGLLRRGVHAELDQLTALSLEGMGFVAELEAKEREKTGISSLKIRRNRAFGFFIEVTLAQMHRVPDRYMRKQTLTNGERYVTVELKELEERVLGADEQRKQLEYDLLVELRSRTGDQSARLCALARRLAALDALASLADVASRLGWARPTLDEETTLDIREGRHPVVEALLEQDRFVPNDVRLDTETRRLVVLTGPNMSGKSTVMRQTALIVLLAQVGSFVPAASAHIGLCDRIFTRVGAADDLTRGQSTFMVEMSETASILSQATKRSLVLLDEIGRGTSTYDGLSIAWAVAEDLVDRVGCRAMFATHYHELCELVETRERVVNQSVAVSEWGERIVFLRRLKEGGASRSYGIQCARLAGLPIHVVTRAQALLTRFEKHAPRNERNQLSLFGSAASVTTPEETEPEVDTLRRVLAEVNPDQLSPRQALSLVYELLEHL